MVAARSELADGLRVGSEAELTGFGIRSHLADGRVVAWTGSLPGRLAIDAELDRPVPHALAARFGSHDFWGRWTRLECVAKLTGTPVVRLLREPDLASPPVPGLTLTTLSLAPDLVVSAGLLAAPRAGHVTLATELAYFGEVT